MWIAQISTDSRSRSGLGTHFDNFTPRWVVWLFQSLMAQFLKSHLSGLFCTVFTLVGLQHNFQCGNPRTTKTLMLFYSIHVSWRDFLYISCTRCIIFIKYISKFRPLITIFQKYANMNIIDHISLLIVNRDCSFQPLL